MKLRYVRLNDNARMPVRAHESDAGYDLFTDKEYIIPAGATAKIGTGIALEIPEGYYMEIVPRSGISATTNLRISNSPGIIDSGYRGEIMVLVTNISNPMISGQSPVHSEYAISKGTKIAQMILRKIYEFELEEAVSLSDSERGTDGFGSTGTVAKNNEGGSLKELAGCLDPLAVKKFLERRGWQTFPAEFHRMYLLVKKIDGHQCQVEIPKYRELADYGKAMLRAAKILAQSCNETPYELLCEMIEYDDDAKITANEMPKTDSQE